MAQIEEAHQITLFEWVERVRARYPLLRLLHHIPNGGLRHKAVAGKLKAMGAKAGVPDLFLPVAREIKGVLYHGLYIEMKKPATRGSRAGTTTDVQRRWVHDLREQGYRVEIAFGWEQAAEILKGYLA